jgi:hypothetical protein
MTVRNIIQQNAAKCQIFIFAGRKILRCAQDDSFGYVILSLGGLSGFVILSLGGLSGFVILSLGGLSGFAA